VTFIPGGELAEGGVAAMAALVRKELTRLEAAGTLKPGEVETVAFPPPRFGLWVSLKAGKTALLPGTKFRESSTLALASPEGYDAEKLRQTVIAKYGQCIVGAFNVLVIQPANDVLDAAARDLDLDFLQTKRPLLAAVVLLSSWPGSSRVLRNPEANPPSPGWLMDALDDLAGLDDDMWTSRRGVPSLGRSRAGVR
jgi:hypothetical protein